MTVWAWVLLACLLSFVTKLLGYVAPDSLLDSPPMQQATSSVTVGLLAALVVSNTFASGQTLTVDARLAALITAMVALKLRAPFLAVVVSGAVAAALARLAGLA